MATLTVGQVVPAGLNDALVAAAGGGDSFLPSDKTLIRVNNGGAGAITVTIITAATAAQGLAIADAGGSVPNAQSRLFGPFPAELYADPADGLADITYSGVTTVTVGAFKL